MHFFEYVADASTSRLYSNQNSSLFGALQVNGAMAQEMRVIEAKYKPQKQTLFAQRNQVYKQLPEFWLQTLLAHPDIVSVVSVADTEVLAYLDEVGPGNYWSFLGRKELVRATR